MRKPLPSFYSILTCLALAISSSLSFTTPALASGDAKAPDRTTGEGPYKRLILRGGIVISGKGKGFRMKLSLIF